MPRHTNKWLPLLSSDNVKGAKTVACIQTHCFSYQQPKWVETWVHGRDKIWDWTPLPLSFMTSICRRDKHVPRTLRAIGERNLAVNTSWIIRWKKNNNKKQPSLTFYFRKESTCNFACGLHIILCVCGTAEYSTEETITVPLHLQWKAWQSERVTTATRQRRTTSTRLQLRLENKKKIPHIHSSYNAGLSKRITGRASEYRAVKQAA